MAKFGGIIRSVVMVTASFVTFPPTLFAIDEARLLERYVLIGVISADGPAKNSGIAVVRDKLDKRSLMLRKGDRLPNSEDWQVAMISKSGVTLSREGRQVELLQGSSEEEKKTRLISVTPEADSSYKPLNPYVTDKAVISEHREPKSKKRIEEKNEDLEVKKPGSAYDYKTEPSGESDDDEELFFGPEDDDFEENINAENNTDSEDDEALLVLPLTEAGEKK